VGGPGADRRGGGGGAVAAGTVDHPPQAPLRRRLQGGRAAGGCVELHQQAHAGGWRFSFLLLEEEGGLPLWTLGSNCCQPASQPGALELHAPRLRMCRLEAGCSQGAAPRSCVAAPAGLPTTAAPPRLQTQDMVGRSLATNLIITIYAFMVGAGGRGRGRRRHTQPAAPPPVQQRRPAWLDHRAQRRMPAGCRVSNPPPLPHHPLRHTRRC
jgi:hypothetical protein